MPIRRIIALMIVLMMIGCAAIGEMKYDLSGENIRSTVEYLCGDIGIRETGTEAERTACDWLFEQLSGMGFSAEDNSLQRTEFSGLKEKTSENLIAVCNAGYDGPIFSIVAHYDSVPTSTGARDNGAAVGILLEIARLLGDEDETFPCEVRMVFLGSEENGYHGSRAYVSGLTEEEKKRHMGAFNMDIAAASPSDEAQLAVNLLGTMDENGEYQEAFFLPKVENTLSCAAEEAYRMLYGKELGGVFYHGESDHVPFHDAGLEAINLCWRKVEDELPVLPESYHQMSDTPDDLDYDTAVITGRCLMQAIELLIYSK